MTRSSPRLSPTCLRLFTCPGLPVPQFRHGVSVAPASSLPSSLHTPSSHVPTECCCLAGTMACRAGSEADLLCPRGSPAAVPVPHPASSAPSLKVKLFPRALYSALTVSTIPTSWRFEPGPQTLPRLLLTEYSVLLECSASSFRLMPHSRETGMVLVLPCPSPGWLAQC